MLTLKCHDAGFDCNRIIKGETEQEVINSVKEHALRDHKITSNDINPNMLESIKKLIKTDE